jgi:hypothetical protein
LRLPERRSFFRRIVGRRKKVRRRVAVRQRVIEAAADPRSLPLVVVACRQCGFNYEVTKIAFDDGSAGAIWSCECGSRYIPPGGGDSFNLVRP